MDQPSLDKHQPLPLQQLHLSTQLSSALPLLSKIPHALVIAAGTEVRVPASPNVVGRAKRDARVVKSRGKLRCATDQKRRENSCTYDAECFMVTESGSAADGCKVSYKQKNASFARICALQSTSLQ